MKQTILIIEDETSIAETIAYALEFEGFAVEHCRLGGQGLNRLKDNRFSLVVLDVGLPDISGFEVCKKIRQFSDIPIIFLTARADEVDRIVGLEIGADDYVLKPFSPRELCARVRVILKRGKSPPHPAAEKQPNFNVDQVRKTIQYRSVTLELTRYEYLILNTLLAYPGKVFSREALMEQVWDAPEHSLDRAVDTHIKSIRQKLRQVSEDANPIKTHRGMGYSIQPDSVTK